MLTVKRIARLRGAPGRYPDGHGLYLEVQGPNNASWKLRYERGGRERWLGLGPLHTVGLAQARERARAARLQLLDGVDPIDAKRAAAARATRRVTFREVAADYVKATAPRWRGRRAVQDFRGTLRDYVFPKIANMDVESIGIADVLRVLEQPLGGFTRNPPKLCDTYRATRVRSRIETVIDYAIARGLRTADNPARSKIVNKALPQLSAKTKSHLAAMPYVEVPSLVAELRKIGTPAAQALEFAILTAARSGEVLGATWDEIDFDGRVWTVPASRMKSHREHKVALADRAVELLRNAYRVDGNDHVFIGVRGGAMSHDSMREVMRELGRAATVHGFRSSFRDWAAERTNFSREVAEASLSHAISSAVERSYLRGGFGDKRRQLMEAWASFLEAPATSGEVVPLRRAK